MTPAPLCVLAASYFKYMGWNLLQTDIWSLGVTAAQIADYKGFEKLRRKQTETVRLLKMFWLI